MREIWGTARREDELPPERGDTFEPLRRAARITAIMGIVHGILLVSAFVLVSKYGPGTDVGSSKYTEFYSSEHRQRMVFISGIYLIPFAGIAFLWFSMGLRTWLQGRLSRIDELLLSLSFASGIIYVSLLFCAGAALSLVAMEEADASSSLLSASFVRYGSSLFLIFALRMAAMVVFSTSQLARDRGVFPKWFVYAGFPVGLVLLLTSTIEPALVVVFPIWLAILAFLLFRRVQSVDGRIDPRI